jgi:hypothetical protein
MKLAVVLGCLLFSGCSHPPAPAPLPASAPPTASPEPALVSQTAHGTYEKLDPHVRLAVAERQKKIPVLIGLQEDTKDVDACVAAIRKVGASGHFMKFDKGGVVGGELSPSQLERLVKIECVYLVEADTPSEPQAPIVSASNKIDPRLQWEMEDGKRELSIVFSIREDTEDIETCRRQLKKIGLKILVGTFDINGYPAGTATPKQLRKLAKVDCVEYIEKPQEVRIPEGE